MAAEVSFVELRKQAQALGINVTGKRPADLQKEIDKLATKKTAPATATKSKAGPVTTKVTPAAAIAATPAADVRVLALEEEVEGLKASIRSLMKALKAMGAEIGFDVGLDTPEEEAGAAVTPAPSAKKTRGRPKKEEPAPAPEPEEEEEGDDEEAVDFTSEEIEGADMARLKEIAELLNDNNDAEIEIGKNEKKLRAAIMKWMNDNAEKVADDEPEATEKEEAEDEDEDEDDEDEAEATPCPDYCKKGAKVQVMFEAENGEEEWVDGVVAVVESASADVKLASGQVAEVPFDSMRLPVVKKVKAAVKRK